MTQDTNPGISEVEFGQGRPSGKESTLEAKEAISMAWKRLCHEPPEAVLEFLVHQLEILCGYRPDRQLLLNFLEQASRVDDPKACGTPEPSVPGPQEFRSPANGAGKVPLQQGRSATYSPESGLLPVSPYVLVAFEKRRKIAESESHAPKEEWKLHGRVGSLLLFCLAQFILGPLLVLINLFLCFDSAFHYLDESPTALAVFILECAFGLPMTLFGVQAGILLWKADPHGVTRTRQYLAALVSYSISVISLVTIVDLPAQAGEIMLLRSATALFGLVVYAAVCYFYLRTSKQVRTI